VNIIWLIVLVALAAAYPSLFLFLQNYDYIRFVEVLPYLAICVLGGLLLFAVIWALSKRRYYSALISTLVLIVCLNQANGLLSLLSAATLCLCPECRHLCPMVWLCIQHQISVKIRLTLIDSPFDPVKIPSTCGNYFDQRITGL